MFGNNNNNNNNNFTKHYLISQAKYDEILNAALSSHTLLVMDLLDKSNLEPTNSNLVDKSKQNLLHLAVKTKNYMLAEYLIEKKVSQIAKNIFNETPVDIAIKNNDIRMIELLYGVNKMDNYKQLTQKLEDKCDDMKFNYEKILSENTNLSYKLEESTKTNKRLRDTNDVQEREIKRLKTDNVRLSEDNKILQTTVTNLRNSMKK